MNIFWFYLAHRVLIWSMNLILQLYLNHIFWRATNHLNLSRNSTQKRFIFLFCYNRPLSIWTRRKVCIFLIVYMQFRWFFQRRSNRVGNQYHYRKYYDDNNCEEGYEFTFWMPIVVSIFLLLFSKFF